jgi:hypothetical protein
MPKKGSRKLQVDDRAYRWLVVSQAERLMVLVEAWDCAGQQLRAYFGYDWPTHYNPEMALDYGVEYRHRAITPAEVASLIRRGLQRGWEPWQVGRQAVELADANQLVCGEGVADCDVIL